MRVRHAVQNQAQHRLTDLQTLAQLPPDLQRVAAGRLNLDPAMLQPHVLQGQIQQLTQVMQQYRVQITQVELQHQRLTAQIQQQQQHQQHSAQHHAQMHHMQSNGHQAHHQMQGMDQRHGLPQQAQLSQLQNRQAGGSNPYAMHMQQQQQQRQQLGSQHLQQRQNFNPGVHHAPPQSNLATNPR